MIEIKNLTKTYIVDKREFNALEDINLTINDGDIYGIIGMSGAGKSTLVRCINMLTAPTKGSVIINGIELNKLSQKELLATRHEVSMIFQNFNLLMQRNCLDNICFPLELTGTKKSEARKKAMELLETVGLPDKAKAYPAQLSGGQQQRIAIARALATNPKVLLCDEATSALDPKTTKQILELIKEINKKTGITVVIITHQMNVVEEICNKVAIIEKGKIVEQGDVETIFTAPKSNAAKKLIISGNPNDMSAISYKGKYLRVVFNGAEASEAPLIAQMVKSIGVEASILEAQTKSLGERAYGTMILGIPEGTNFNDVKNYLCATENITVEEVERNA